MIYSAYFSATGNTKKLVNFFSEGKNEIDLTKDVAEISFDNKDILYLGVPSFGGRAPLYAIEKIKLFKGNNTRAIILASYGNRACEDTLIELRDILANNGFIVIAGVEAVMPHSIFTEVSKNRPDEKDLKELSDFKERIRLKLLNNDFKEALIPGNRPYKERKPGGLVPQVNSNCIMCGLCAGLCPVGAISKLDPSIVDGEKCIHCMRCISVCEFDGREIERNLLDSMYERLEPKFAGRKTNNLYI